MIKLKSIVLSILLISMLLSCIDDDSIVVDDSTNVTIISAENYTGLVAENISKGMSIGKVSARTTNGELTYAIKSQEPAGAIVIDDATGGTYSR